MGVDITDHCKSLFILHRFLKATNSAACLLTPWGEPSWPATCEQPRVTHHRNLPLQIVQWLLRKILKFETYLESLPVTRIILDLKSHRHLRKISRRDF